jgi:hypothetical protein
MNRFKIRARKSGSQKSVRRNLQWHSSAISLLRGCSWPTKQLSSLRSHLVTRKSYPTETKCQSLHLCRYTTFLEIAQTTCSLSRNVCTSPHSDPAPQTHCNLAVLSSRDRWQTVCSSEIQLILSIAERQLGGMPLIIMSESWSYLIETFWCSLLPRP